MADTKKRLNELETATKIETNSYILIDDVINGSKKISVTEFFNLSNKLLGITGSVGPTGPTGPTGSTGPTGTDGLTTSVKYKGTTYTHTNGLITLPDIIDADTIGGKKIVSLKQSEYDALATKDNDTIYIITDAVESTTNITNADTTDGYHIWAGTQSKYDALTPDENTIYIITDATAEVTSSMARKNNNMPNVVGVTGPTGPTGSQGLKGDTGVVGPTGPQGLQGIQGMQGPQGIQGPIGPTGPTGPQGPVGLRGTTGKDGLTTSIRYQGILYNQSAGIIELPNEIDANKINGHSIEVITQNEYESLIDKDENTIYIMKDAKQISSLVRNYDVIDEDIISEFDIGGIKAGDKFTAGTATKNIIKKLLTGK